MGNPDVVSIQMRNWCDKKGKEKTWHFKGSIFITFKTEEACKAFVEGDAKYKEKEIEKKFQKDYFSEKAKENEDRKKGHKRGGKDAKENEKKVETVEEPAEDDFKLPT